MSDVTPIQEWKKPRTTHPLTLPSGKTCLVRPVGIEAFLVAGIIPNSLMKTVSKALTKPGQKSEAPNIEELMATVAENPQMLQDVFGMADSVTVFCVIEPAVFPIPAEGESRRDDLLYVDEVDLEDKLFIMNFGMGGSRDLEAFRSATSGGVGSVPASQDVQLPPKSLDWRGE